MRQEVTDQLTRDVIALAQRAAAAIMEVYCAEELAWILKGDASPLCQADLLAHGILVTGLRELTPGVPIVSEEDGDAIPERPIGGQFWLIDPLDGTKEFLSRNNEFTVNVALIEDGQPILGVVVAPALNQAYWGGRGIGAFRVGGDGVCAISVAHAPPARPLRVVASKNHLNEETRAFITGLGVCELVQAGSSLKFCRIADGEADIYPRMAPTCEWDTAAAQAVLEAAGGAVLTLSGQPLRYGKPEVLNPYFIATALGCHSPKDK